jgi:hypothetical protein
MDLTIDELSCISQNIDHPLIKINELSVLHFKLKAFISTHEHPDDMPAALFKALEVRVSMINTCQEGKLTTYDDLGRDPHGNQIRTSRSCHPDVPEDERLEEWVKK